MKQKRQKSIPDQTMAYLDKGYTRLSNGKVNTMADSMKYIVQSTAEYLQTTGMSYRQAVDFTVDRLETDPRILETATQLSAMNNWWFGGRQIYRFDESLVEALESQTKDDLNISPEIFSQLPCPDFFIERYIPERESYGFFFTIIEHYLMFAEVFQGGKSESAIIDLDFGRSIREIIETTVKSNLQNTVYSGNFSEEELLADSPKYIKGLSEMLQYVIYLAAKNADIEAVTTGAVIHKTATKTYTPKNKTEVSNVGYRFGNAIRAVRNAPRVVYDGEHIKGSPKSPHIRRSHFHSYWTGSGENKELIVKWVNTIFVNGSNIDVSTVHDIGKDGKENS